MAAIFAASAGADTLLLERTKDGGRKILISGGGRCNILPSRVDESRFVTDSSAHLLRRIVRSWPLHEQIAFFEREIDLPLVEEPQSAKLFPQSQRAREVRDKLRMELESANPDVGLFRHYAACDVCVNVGDVAEIAEPELTLDLLSRDITGTAYRDLTVAVQGRILTDERIALVRIWRLDGALIYSSAQRDDVARTAARGDPAIERAFLGQTTSVGSGDAVYHEGLRRSTEELLQTFVPIRLGDPDRVDGIVEIDQRYGSRATMNSSVVLPLPFRYSPVAIRNYNRPMPDVLPIARLTINETWYDKGGATVTAGRGNINGLMQPGEVQVVTIETPWKEGMTGFQRQFTHANGSIKLVKVAKLEAPKPETATATSTTAKPGAKPKP